eukprot:4932204-Pleurochrysis_carterae.AAC.1
MNSFKTSSRASFRHKDHSVTRRVLSRAGRLNDSIRRSAADDTDSSKPVSGACSSRTHARTRTHALTHARTHARSPPLLHATMAAPAHADAHAHMHTRPAPARVHLPAQAHARACARRRPLLALTNWTLLTLP